MYARSTFRHAFALTLLLAAASLSSVDVAPLTAQGNSVPLHYRNLTVMVVETYGNNNTRPVRGARVEVAPANGATDPHVEFPLHSSTNARTGVALFTRIPPSRLVGEYRVTVTYPNGCGEETQSIRTGGTTDRRVTFNVNCAQRRRAAASNGAGSNGSQAGMDSSGTSGSPGRNGDTEGPGSNVGGGPDSGVAVADAQPVLAVQNVRLNRNGQIQGDVVWTDGPKPSRSLARATFSWGDGDNAVTEDLRAVVQAPDRPRTVTTRQVVPCDATQLVSVRVEPWFSDGMATGPSETTHVELTRTCSTRQDGTPNLGFGHLERLSRNRVHYAPVPVRVTETDEADNEGFYPVEGDYCGTPGRLQ